MNATELFHQDGSSAGVWYCVTCRGVHNERDSAEQCCRPYCCEKCGAMIPRTEHHTVCSDCRDGQRQERMARRLAEAQEVEGYTGWVCSEEVSGPRYGYFESAESLAEYCEEYAADEGKELKTPEFAFCCTCNSFKVDPRRVIECTETEIELDCVEDYEPTYQGIEEFIAACDKFSMANAGICTYGVDYKRKVRVRTGC